MVGFRARSWAKELAVDNFFAVFFFNDFNAQTLKCMKSTIFIYFCEDLTLIKCRSEKELGSG
jgi:hypothetical protein